MQQRLLAPAINYPHKSKIIPFMQLGSLNMPMVSVVLPAMNEEKNLEHVLPYIPNWVHEIILVDGRSTDKTVEIAQRLCPNNLKVVHQMGRGKGNALREGFAAASGDIIVMIDADGSMSPKEIPLYVGALLSGADFVKGSRFLQGGGTKDMEFFRYLGNLGFTLCVRLLFGGSYSDLCYGYAAFWKHTLVKLDLMSDGFEIETEMNVRALRVGLKVVEVPSFEAKRIHGISNLNTMKDGFRVLQQIVKEYLGTHRKSVTVQQREYTKALYLLGNEAKHLFEVREKFTPKSYAFAREALEDSYRYLEELYAIAD
jgi:glycosyltransferase involved in cell wall biosynthesis